MNDTRIGSPDPETQALMGAITRHVRSSLGRGPEEAAPRDLWTATAAAVRERLTDGLLAAGVPAERDDAKQVCLVSMEYLFGRSLEHNLQSLGLHDACREALSRMGHAPDAVFAAEPDASLGNGGAGRTAAALLDSFAAAGVEGVGYGLNYEAGLFRQELDGGAQRERPHRWRAHGSPWLTERPGEAVRIPCYGGIEHTTDAAGAYRPLWVDAKILVGIPSDFPIVGPGGRTVRILRLYAAHGSDDFDRPILAATDYVDAVRQTLAAEAVTRILYPPEAVAGREERLLQEYVLAACAVRDVVRRYAQRHATFDAFPAKVAFQLNDAGAALTLLELMRVLIDENGLDWDAAGAIVEASCAATFHALVPHTLERWPVPLVQHVLPRHLQILYEINHRFLKVVQRHCPDDDERCRRASLIEEGPTQQVRLGHLPAVVGHASLGLSERHAERLRADVFPDLHAVFPDKLRGVTHGVPHRRVLLAGNPALARVLSGCTGSAWITDLGALRVLEPLAGDPGLQSEIQTARRANKERLARIVKESTGVVVDPDSLFDVQATRFHESTRQLLHLLYVVHEYLLLVEDGRPPVTPRTHIFAGKAAPGHRAAKQVLHLANALAEAVRRDPRTSDGLRVVFLPDHRPSLDDALTTAADLSEQLVAAGTDAVGTSHLRFAMNGALTVATLDSPHLELRDAVGAENLFLFGLTADEATRRREAGASARRDYDDDPATRRVIDALAAGRLGGDFGWVRERLVDRPDPHLHLADFAAYRKAQEDVARAVADPRDWARRSLLTLARMGRFSSDRTVAAYARDVWGIPAD